MKTIFTDIVTGLTDPKSRTLRSIRPPILLIAFTTLAAIGISVYCLTSGRMIIFQNLFYIPIVIACLYYARKGFAFSIALSMLYFVLVISFTNESAIIIQALVRVLFFIVFSGILVLLSIKQAQINETLKSSREKYRNLFNSSRDAIMTLEPPTWSFTSGNPATVAMFGARDAEEFISHGPGDLSPSRQPDGRDSAEKAREMIRKAMNEGTHLFEWTHKRINGEEFPATVLLTRMEHDGKRFLQATVRDISPVKQKEEALRASEEKYRNLVNNQNEGICATDEYEVFTSANPASEKIFGVTQGQLVGRSLAEFITADQWQKVKEQTSRRKRGEKGNYELEVNPEIGEKKTVSLSVNPLVDANNNYIGSYALIRDVTDMKRVQKILQESEEKYRMLVENQGEGIIICDFNELITFGNPAAETIFGVPAGTLNGRHFTEFVSIEAAEHLYQETNRRKQGGKSKYELEIIQPSGERRTILVTAVPQVDEVGKSIGALAVLQDITTQKQVQEELRLNEEKYRSLFDNMINGFAYHRIITDETGRAVDYEFLEVNDAFERMTGLTRGDLIGKRVSAVMPDLKNDSFDWVGTYGRVALEGKETKFEQISELLKKCFMITAYSPAYGFFVTVLEDISEKKRMEKMQQAMYFISESAAKTENLQSLFRIVHEAVKQLINTNNFYIALYAEKDQMISFPYYVDEYDSPPPSRKIGNGLTDVILKTGVPFLNKPTTPSPIDGKNITLVGTESEEWAGVPLKLGDRTFGALVVQTYRKEERFGEDALEILGFMSDNVALAIERKRVEMEIIQNSDTQSALAKLLDLSLKDIPLDKLLDNTIDIILSIPWLSLESRGSISLVEDDPEILVLKAQRNLSLPIQQSCAKVPFGKCFCGRAALTRRIQFTDRVDDQHEVTYTGIIPHGHYCIPILLGQKTLGVINLYLREGHQRAKMEEAFLTSMADALAGVIQRKRTEVALIASEERFKQVTENAEEWIWEVDHDGVYTYSSPVAEKILGYKPEELIGKKHFFDLFTPETRDELGQAAQSGFAQRVPIRGFVNPNSHKDGRVVILETNGVPYFGPDGTYLGYRGTDKDITLRRSLEEERERLIVELQESLDNVKTLKGLVPICSSCKKIRDDGGYWQQVEEYVAKHTEADFSHGLCDECAHTLYPEYFKDKKNKSKDEVIG